MLNIGKQRDQAKPSVRKELIEQDSTQDYDVDFDDEYVKIAHDARIFQVTGEQGKLGGIMLVTKTDDDEDLSVAMPLDPNDLISLGLHMIQTATLLQAGEQDVGE